MTSGALGLLLLLQAAPRLPVLAFPEPGMDDPAAYQGYQTRFYRDSKGNAVQIYLDPSGRVVLVWADAANESIGFTLRDGNGRPVPLAWDGDTAQVSDSGITRSIEYRLSAAAQRVTAGWFLLGTMRVERDFQYGKHHLKPFTAPPFQVAEESLLVANVARLPVAERRRHLALLGAPSVSVLRSRLEPTLTSSRSDTAWVLRVRQPALDGKTHLALEVRVDPREVTARVAGRTVSFVSRGPASIRFRVRATTDAAPLTPLTREQIFNRDFLSFHARAGTARDSAGVAQFRRLEREVRGVELLSSEEKLMAGLPNFATYFGRDMLMTALMMRPIWSEAMAEHVIASVLRKLGPSGEVSHEEALGGQAIREHAAEYNALIAAAERFRRLGRPASADSVLGLARLQLAQIRTVRENYHMLDDEFQLPVLVARYLADSAVTPARKRSFLLAASDSNGSRLRLLLRELALVGRLSGPYVKAPSPTTLVGFVKRDSTHWRSSSWRDSDAGYAQGRFAMDINAIWVPQALEAIGQIRSSLQELGFSGGALDSLAPDIAGSPLAEYLADSASLRRAIATWQKAERHFAVTLTPDEIRHWVEAKLAWLPEDERRYWEQAFRQKGASDSLSFPALSLDSAGHPIPVVNTDPATALFLENFTAPVDKRHAAAGGEC